MEKELQTIGAGLPVAEQFNPDQVALLKRTICKGSTDDEFQLFLYQCKRTRLDPFARQIHAVMRWDSKAGKNIMSIQTGIDGYRLVADRTGLYEGQTPYQWCGIDGQWRDVWLETFSPSAARVGVWKNGFRDPVYAVALWTEYAQSYFKDGKQVMSPMWAKMGALMLGKCAEALALRKVFPQELSGLYTQEEMQQADSYAPERAAPAIEAPEGHVSTEDEKNHATAMKKARAALNVLLQACKTEKEFKAARGTFKKEYGDIWEKRTYHNETETFKEVVNEHWARVWEEIEFVKTWEKDLEAATVETFPNLETRFENHPALNDSVIHLDLLRAKGKELGFTYSEET